jgi:hypothetical protein
MCTFLREKIFRGKLPDSTNLQKQCIYVIDRTKPPACFINHDAGLLTFEGIDLDVGSRELPLPASYMLDERRERYRKRVLSFKPTDAEAPLRNLLNGARNKELFKHIFHGAKDDHPDPAHGKDAPTMPRRTPSPSSNDARRTRCRERRMLDLFRSLRRASPQAKRSAP